MKFAEERADKAEQEKELAIKKAEEERTKAEEERTKRLQLEAELERVQNMMLLLQGRK